MESLDLQALADQAGAWLQASGPGLLWALAVLGVGWWLAGRVSRLTGRVLAARRLDATMVPFIQGLVHYTLVSAVVLAALAEAGVNVMSFVAVLGAAGLAVGLALKDSLSNFAAGLMLLFFRFFKVGDYVTVAGVSGAVFSLGIFNTELTTPDNQKIFVPNAAILGGQIVNVTAMPTRRLDLVVGIGYGDDMRRAREVIGEALAAEPRLLAEPAPVVAVAELGESSVNLVVRPWVKTEEYWAVRFDLIESIKNALDAAGITIPFPQREVHFPGGPPSA